MARADVLTLASSLSASQADSTAAGNYYDRIVQEHGLSRLSLTDADFVAVTAGTLGYSLPSAAIRALALLYDDAQLYRDDKAGLEASDEGWRTTPGEPRIALFEDAAGRTFDLVPVPRRAGASIGVATPFSGTFPNDNVTVIYTDTATNVQSWEELAQACEILAREFGRDSDHRDTDASGAWRQLADLLFGVIDKAHGTSR